VRDALGNKRIYKGAISPLATDRWVRIDFGVAEGGDVDMSIIRSVAIAAYAGSGRSSFVIDDIQVREKPEVGHLIFSFEDSHERDYTLAYPTLSEHDMVGAVFTPTNSLDEGSNPSLSQYREMADDGWLIGAHTVQHQRLPDFSGRVQQRILQKNIEQLREIGFDTGAEHFRTTRGSYNSPTLDHMRELFESSIVPMGSATGTAVRATDPSTIGYKGGDNYDRAKDLIDAAVKHRQLLGLTLHMRHVDDADGFRSVVERAAKYVEEGRLRVTTPDKLYEEYLQDESPLPD